jgi:hypothetical protein
MNQLTICIVAQNEQENLPRVLKSVQEVSDEIVVVDGGSTDRTAAIAKEHGARVVQRAFTTHADQKNYAASLATHNWIFLLDADEELSDDLKASVLQWKKSQPSHPVYEMARLTWYLGAWIHHSRWYPDWQRRIYRRDRAHFEGAIPRCASKVQPADCRAICSTTRSAISPNTRPSSNATPPPLPGKCSKTASAIGVAPCGLPLPGVGFAIFSSAQGFWMAIAVH